MPIIIFLEDPEEIWVKFSAIDRISFSEEFLRIVLETNMESYIIHFPSEACYNNAYYHLMHSIEVHAEFADLAQFQLDSMD